MSNTRLPRLFSRPRTNVLKLQKHRLGKAWEKMRNWLRDETSRINEVVNKHARLQAVGALSEESCTVTVPNGNSASYDLTKAKTPELGSITRVEEFGLSSVSQERLKSSSSSPETVIVSSKTNVALHRAPTKTTGLGKMIATSDNVLNEKSEPSIVPVSFSMDKLCSDTEIDETHDAATAGEIDSRDHARKAGLIKRRMLGSIRGLMASTHLLHSVSVHETEEVHSSISFHPPRNAITFDRNDKIPFSRISMGPRSVKAIALQPRKICHRTRSFLRFRYVKIFYSPTIAPRANVDANDDSKQRTKETIKAKKV